MMPEDIKQRLRTRPFQPIRFHLTDGAKYDVYYPDTVLVCRTEVAIGCNGDEDRVPDKIIFCNPADVETIETIADRVV